MKYFISITVLGVVLILPQFLKEQTPTQTISGKGKLTLQGAVHACHTVIPKGKVNPHACSEGMPMQGVLQTLNVSMNRSGKNIYYSGLHF